MSLLMEMARRAAARPTYNELLRQRDDLLSALGQALDLSEVLIDCCDTDQEKKKQLQHLVDAARRGFDTYSSLVTEKP